MNALHTYTYDYDGNGNVVDVMDDKGTSVAHYEYDPFGRTVIKSGTFADDNHWRFSTKYQDETGLYYYGYRYYSPELGRWPSRDPIWESGGRNLYRFAVNAPVDWVDKDGRITLGAGGVVVCVAATCYLVRECCVLRNFPATQYNSPFPEDPDDIGGQPPQGAAQGWYKHCRNSCELMRAFGLQDPLASPLTSCAARWAGDDFPFQESYSPSDVRANEKGRELAAQAGSCEDLCTAAHPNNPINLPAPELPPIIEWPIFPPGAGENDPPIIIIILPVR